MQISDNKTILFITGTFVSYSNGIIESPAYRIWALALLRLADLLKMLLGMHMESVLFYGLLMITTVTLLPVWIRSKRK